MVTASGGPLHDEQEEEKTGKEWLRQLGSPLYEHINARPRRTNVLDSCRYPDWTVF